MRLKIVLFVLISLILITFSASAVDIEAVQKILKKEGYMPGPIDGFLGEKTIDGLVAYQKAYGLPQRLGKIDTETKIALKVKHDLKPKKKIGGLYLEVNIRRQLLYVVRDGSIEKIINVSTGKDERTPLGTFSIYEKITEGWVTAYSSEWKPQGKMYKPLKFYKLFYIHGSSSVPSKPASLGCVRVKPWHMEFLHKITEIGTKIIIY